ESERAAAAGARRRRALLRCRRLRRQRPHLGRRRRSIGRRRRQRDRRAFDAEGRVTPTATLTKRDVEEHRALLWAIAYRMTGVAADADDVVQETFARALVHPPERGSHGERSLRPWLVKVAMNAARDTLRKRRRIEYVGPWLPS